MGTVAGSLTNSIVGLDPQTPTPADTDRLLGNIVNQAQSGMEKFTGDLFKNGNATWKKAPDGSTNVTLADFMSKGQLMQAPATNASMQATLMPLYSRFLFQQLAVQTWANLANPVSVPYITFENGKCGKTTGNSLDGPLPRLDRNSVAADVEGDCYYLLGAQALGAQTECPLYGEYSYYPCDGKKALPGGTHTVLTGKNDTYGGLIVKDFIYPAVKM